MAEYTVLYIVFIIFTSAAVLATLSLFTRQSLLVAYIVLGILLGPSMFKVVLQVSLVRNIGDIGIIFLLFLLGLDLNPKELLQTLRKTTQITLLSCVLFGLLSFSIAYLFGFNVAESVLIGIASVFSSTIIGLKLLPSAVLHYQRTGELIISVLLLQDLVAIATLIFMHGADMTGSKITDFGLMLITLPSLILFAFGLQRYLIAPLFARFDRVQEYIFLLALGWCLGLGEVAHLLGLSYEIGAFLAGVSIAEGPIATYIAQSLKPLRDFCLVMFFFSIGASFDIRCLHHIWLPAVILSFAILFGKPLIFTWLFQRTQESRAVAQEIGIRLGQMSEFSLLLGCLAVGTFPHLISVKANYLIQATTLLTFIGSSYWVVLRYPTPTGFPSRARAD